MNIKELADIGAAAAKAKLQNGGSVSVDPRSGFWGLEAEAREAFAQAIIDAYNKDARKGILNLARNQADLAPEQHQAANSVLNKTIHEDDMLRKRVHELMAENTVLRNQLENSKERQEFEQWYADTLCDPVEDIGETNEKNIAWDAWKAARKSK